MRKTKAETEKTYNTLLDTAATLFTEQGVVSTTLNDIAKSAGMTRGAVYWHFSNKDEVVQALWERHARTRHEAILQHLQGISACSRLADLEGAFTGVAAAIDEDPYFANALRLAISAAESSAPDSTLRQFLNEKRDAIYDSLLQALDALQRSGEITADLPVTAVANTLWAFLIGSVHMQIDLCRPNNAKLIKQGYMTSLLFRGIASQNAAG